VERPQILAAIGSNIRRSRVQANLTQEGLAEQVGIHWKTLGYIEAGKRDFGASVLVKIALTLKLTTDDLFHGVSLDKRITALIAKATRRKHAAKSKRRP
jgi:DNA-binding XRE family transcriptional regulator